MKCWIALALMKHDTKPEGRHTVTNRIFADDPQGLVDFIQNVFKSTGEFRTDRPTVLTVGDSMTMISGTDVRAASHAFLYVYVGDTESLLATYRRAVAAGARTIEEPTLTPYGDRRFIIIEDTWGNTWQIATHLPRLPR